jgi:hypothetical protein
MQQEDNPSCVSMKFKARAFQQPALLKTDATGVHLRTAPIDSHHGEQQHDSSRVCGITSYIASHKRVETCCKVLTRHTRSLNKEKIYFCETFLLVSQVLFIYKNKNVFLLNGTDS